MAEALVHEAEKRFHLREREFLTEKNQIATDSSAASRSEASKAFEEGRLLGKAENQRDHVIELAKQRETSASKLQEEREKAAADAREKLRAEYELQAKLFSVKISPYFKVGDDKGWVRTQHDVNIGYQYQLLINGIPAFQPHVVIERSESFSAIDEKVKTQLLNVATGLAEAAISTYLGASPQFAKLAPAIIDQKGKSSIENSQSSADKSA